MNSKLQWFAEGEPNIWLPYTKNFMQLPVKSANGCYIFLENGHLLLDGISSWWSVCHGYSHPYIVHKIQEQVETLSHIMLSGFAHEQGYRLASQLVKIAPVGLEKVFFSDSGSTAIEVAIKMAVQYFCNIGKCNKYKLISFYNGYHGDTMGCMSVSDPKVLHGSVLNKYYPNQYILKLPHTEEDMYDFTAQLELLHNDVAAVIIEPILQAAGGMKIYSPVILQQIYNITREYDILFIADEVATGFGRTGMMFACNHANITPDIMVVGKALTGGFCTLAATLTTQNIYDTFTLNTDTAFRHGPTFMANPLACAAANASIDLFINQKIMENIKNIELQLTKELKIFEKLHFVSSVRVIGAVGVIELNSGYINIINQDLTQKLLQLKIWIKPIGDVIYIMPPFIITSKELTTLIESINELLKTID
ncbi:adenosylmethionine--8-amino-7-oxononanoate transaminase [Neoehrlichia mikurensis]|uniref:Adenosylmethionine-8-amino-7-oxononanoate aminotransferase n=1 Tax=Neoehrlichia mikurensis TaxID=89586 RepID=A0A9Q9BUL1_9RICK|nr:adenosylmethionine--8-amino-7-oxononanoate transaminase [Neoehrlichia mikurensis]QXK91946.1 adenosylmethionine--8-amino-7-oxononanoate transaminase [Neoehrlichia mikurensis]QXK93159.1 adenosylmethionine--8-amino-7-oxononanoate transaminase [Neoehrlichia mikurensis]QXK93638.1 adenosylmethionine--8-amino-7-oxononanoate transaminase [Neoehrlichia mikurensis]UTO55406.1 adenosylmethionine--8-amino-7-oxononanoate transaminase [Neoehrlichia mikurensis]UTO56325.1 adenosylmethionine--8-amino-7-oxono